jgi:predicted DsbA family dithiol-disulfide isomerase
MCILTYAVNFTLLYFAWLIRRRFNEDSLFVCLRADADLVGRYMPQTVVVGALIAAIAIGGAAFYPPYWQYVPPKHKASLSTGRTPEGRPWIGAQQPELIIEEYADYLCFQCSKMHAYLRELVGRYPDKIRLVHYHFPMDSAYNPLVKESFHEGAGKMALLAMFAETQNKFWPMNDLLFEKGRQRENIETRELCETLDLDCKMMSEAIGDPILLKRLWQDIRSGLKHKIMATPSFIVDGKVYEGMIPADILQSVID